MIEITCGVSRQHVLTRTGLFFDSKMINVSLLSATGSLNNIINKKLETPYNIIVDDTESKITDILKIIKKDINIRLWISKNNVENYMILLFVLNILREDINKYNISVIDLSKINIKDYKIYDLLELVSENISEVLCYEEKLKDNDINKYLSLWDKLYNENAPIRIIENNTIKSVTEDYFDSIIMNFLKKSGKIKLFKLIFGVMSDWNYEHGYLSYRYYCYRIYNLIKNKKIIIVKYENEKEVEHIWYISDSFLNSIIKSADQY